MKIPHADSYHIRRGNTSWNPLSGGRTPDGAGFTRHTGTDYHAPRMYPAPHHPDQRRYPPRRGRRIFHPWPLSAKLTVLALVAGILALLFR